MIRRTSFKSKTAPRPFWPVVSFIVFSAICLLLSDTILHDANRHPILLFTLRIPFLVGSALVLLVLIRHERRVRSLQTEYNQMMHTLLQPIVVHVNGVIIDVNDHAVDFFEAKSKSDIIGRDALDFVHPSYRELTSARMQQLHSGQPTQRIEQIFLTIHGQPRHVEVVGTPALVRGQPAGHVIFNDVTQRKRDETMLQRVVEQFKCIEDNMTDAIVVLHANGGIEYASPSLESILGYSRTRLCEETAEHIHPEDLPLIRGYFRQGAKFRMDARVRHGHGHWVTMELNGTPAFDEQGNLQKMILVARDVTERRQTEELLRRTDKLAVVGELAAGVAHEIRNPLTAVKGFIQLLHNKSDDATRRYFDIVSSEVTRIESTLQDLLILAKPQMVHFKPGKLERVLGDVIDLLHPESLLKNVSIQYQTCLEVPQVQCDENQVKQVFLNIMKNAIEAMTAGGVLRVTMESYNDQVHILFQDQGPGMTDEQLSRVGQPFYSTKDSGTGLGLTVSLKILQQHGGTMQFRSELGKGTTVHVFLPACTPEPMEHL